MSVLMADIKILCTGNPNKDYTLASCIRTAFPNTTFIYKSNGFDLTTAHGLELFRKESKVLTAHMTGHGNNDLLEKISGLENDDQLYLRKKYCFLNILLQNVFCSLFFLM